VADVGKQGVVMVQVIEVHGGREIARASQVAELLGDRIDDIRDAIVAGARTVAGTLRELDAAPGWNLDEVSASFGLTLAAEAGVILSKASASAAFDITVKFQRVAERRSIA
jgi:hypothetical protein